MTYKGSNTAQNEKPWCLAATKHQGKATTNGNGNSNNLDPQAISRSKYTKRTINKQNNWHVRIENRLNEIEGLLRELNKKIPDNH